MYRILVRLPIDAVVSLFLISLRTFLRLMFLLHILCRIIGLRPGGFGIFIGVLMFEALIAIALGLCVSASVPTVGN